MDTIKEMSSLNSFASVYVTFLQADWHDSLCFYSYFHA